MYVFLFKNVLIYSRFYFKISEQNLIDCTAEYGNHGCSGGLALNGWKYAKKNGGIDKESAYEYTRKAYHAFYILVIIKFV